MRTLVDLLNTDHGYARIYAGPDGYGYELSTYLPRPISDLFERMSGYESVTDAFEAAQHQLSAVPQAKKSRARRSRIRA